MQPDIQTWQHALPHGITLSCRACGESIPFDRLKVEPWAERCVPCASALEQSKH